MLELLGLRLTASEIYVITDEITQSFDVNLNIEQVTKHDDENVSLVFTYLIKYLPDVASVKLRGIAYCRDKPQNVKSLMGVWEKKKEVPPEMGAEAVNMINANVSITALMLTRPFNLLPHFMPPPIFVPSMGAPARAMKKKTAKKKKKGKRK